MGLRWAAAVDNPRVEPAPRRAEVGAPRRAAYFDIGRKACRRGRRGAGSLRDAAADRFEADQLNRLLGPGAVAVGALVLGAKRLFQGRERGGVYQTRRQRHPQFEGLALIMQAGAAADLDPLRRKSVLGQAGTRLGFEPVDNVLNLCGSE